MVTVEMKVYELETEYGVLQYEILNAVDSDEDALGEKRSGCEVMLTGYRGKDIKLTIPEKIAGTPVTIVGKKAFLGAKGLRRISLPTGVTDIREWAFASCSNLEIVLLPHRKIVVGQGIFKDCIRLQRIISIENKEAADESTASEAVSYLLAAAVNKLDAFYLFDPAAAGNDEWLKQWDARMMSLMEQEDVEGFSKMLLCGEEDYGSRENNLDYYVEQRRRFKVRLAMLRLMYDIGLDSDHKEKLISYLQAHKKGECQEETWKVVLEEHGNEREYYQFLLDHECINGENFDAVLSDMGEKHTEMKAFLMNNKSKWIHAEDAFGVLEL